MNSHVAGSRGRQPNRRILTRRNSTTITGQFNSVREDGVLRAFQSYPEFLHLAILDVDPDVADFETRPESFDLPGSRVYLPDTLIWFRSGRRPTYRAVKPMAHLQHDPDFDGRLRDIVNACEARGADFELVTEKYWLEPIRWSICSHLRHAVRRSTRLEMDIVRDLLTNGALSVAEIIRGTNLAHTGKFAALSLCVSGEATFRQNRPITNETVIWLTA